MATATSKIEQPKVVSQAEWLAARKELLTKEKQFTKLRDDLSRQRCELRCLRLHKGFELIGRQHPVHQAHLQRFVGQEGFTQHQLLGGTLVADEARQQQAGRELGA